MQSKVAVLVAGALASMALTGHVFAQSNVTIYGIADSGIEVINNTTAAANADGTMFRLSSGNLSGSRLGFRGVEDLGGGMKTIFILEGGIALDTGTSLQGNRMFGRQALVGLQGSWGNLYLGRQNSMQLEWMSKYNTMDNASWSAKVHDASFSDRMDNAIKYTKKFGSVEMATYYSTNYNGQEIAGENKVGRQYGLGFQYSGNGFRTAVLYDQKQGTTIATKDNTDKHLTFGGRYKFDDAEVLGGYLMRKQEVVGAADVRTNMMWIGANYKISAPLEFRASVYHTDRKNSNQDPTSVVTLLKYSLSKRTDLYLINSYAWNRSDANLAQTLGVGGFGNTASGTVAAGKNQFGTMAGIRHTF